MYCTCIFFLLIHFTPDTSVLLASGDYLLIDCGQFTPRFVLLQLHFHLTFAFVLTNINSGRKFFFSFYSSLHHQPSLCICILRRDIFRWGSSRQLFMPNDVAILRGEDLGGSEPCGNSVYTYSLHYLYLFWKGKQTWQKYMLQQN